MAAATVAADDMAAMTSMHMSRAEKQTFQVRDGVDPFWVRGSVSLVFLLLTGIIIGETATSLHLYNRLERLTGLETRIISNGVTAAAITFWPVLWDRTIGFERLVEQPRTMFGFFWPMVISAFDLSYALGSHRGSTKTMNALANGLVLDSQAIVSAAFAVGALLASVRSVRGTHIIMYSLICCLALVVPTIASPNDHNRAIILSVQRSALNYSIGYIVAGIGADFLNGGASNPLYARM